MLDGAAINITVNSNGIKKSISGLSGGEKKLGRIQPLLWTGHVCVDYFM